MEGNMASITRQNIGKHTYLYESHSFRDELGRPRNKKIKIGKVDPNTGRALFTDEYIERMQAAGTPVAVPPFDGLDKIEDRIARALDSLRDYGVFYFLKSIVEQTGIQCALKQAVSSYWMEMSMLSFYLLAGNRPFMYMQDWLEENECYPVGTMSPPRISELLVAFGQKERNAFFSKWIEGNISDEYMALDITSISSYSQMMNECEWGYNRDGEALPQLNLCLLFGEGSGLPVYQASYSGSLKDVSTFRSTVAQMKAVCGEKRLILVMDKGFYSKKNVEMLLRDYSSFYLKWSVIAILILE